MKLDINPNRIWYHGSSYVFMVLRKGSTMTKWKELAEAFLHHPSKLSYEEAVNEKSMA